MSSIFKNLNSYILLRPVFIHFLLSYQILNVLWKPHTFLSRLYILLSVFLHHPVGITLMETPHSTLQLFGFCSPGTIPSIHLETLFPDLSEDVWMWFFSSS